MIVSPSNFSISPSSNSSHGTSPVGQVLWEELFVLSSAILRLRGLIYHMRVFFLYESAEKVLSYAHLNCAAFNQFYMSLGQVRHTIVVSRYQNQRKDNEIQL